MNYLDPQNIAKGGKRFYQIPIGILCLDSIFPKLEGHLRNPRTYDFPTVTRLMKNITIRDVLFNPTKEMIAPFIEAAQQLEAEGVHAITGSCGFLAMFQKEIAASVHIPVFMSSLLQIPLIRVMHGQEAKIGVLTASAKALEPQHFTGCGTSINEVVIQGMEGNPEFEECILQGKRHDFDLNKLGNEIISTALKFIEEQKLDALLLECTDLPPYAKQIQQLSNVPVYDINSLMRLVESSVRHKF